MATKKQQKKKTRIDIGLRITREQADELQEATNLKNEMDGGLMSRNDFCAQVVLREARKLLKSAKDGA